MRRASSAGRARARAVVVLLAALLCAAVAFSLGVWQLDRAAQKQSLQRELEDRSALPMLAQSALASTLAESTAQYQRRVRLRGAWVATATVFLDNRQMNARPGFFVLTPLRLRIEPGIEQTGAAVGPLIWVQRGDGSRVTTIAEPCCRKCRRLPDSSR